MQTRIVRAALRRRLQAPPPGWSISLTAVSPSGRHLEVGTEVSIRGERGRFRFMRHVVNHATGAEWMDFWGGPKHAYQWRSFRPDRIRTVHRVNKTDANVLAASRAGKASNE